MDIQRDEAFEEAYSNICKPIIARPYPRDENGEYVYKEIYESYLMWQAAKASVPEGFVLVEKLQLAQLMADMDYMGKKALGSDYVSFADVATVLDEVIEAQEPSNDS